MTTVPPIIPVPVNLEIVIEPLFVVSKNCACTTLVSSNVKLAIKMLNVTKPCRIFIMGAAAKVKSRASGLVEEVHQPGLELGFSAIQFQPDLSLIHICRCR